MGSEGLSSVVYGAKEGSDSFQSCFFPLYVMLLPLFSCQQVIRA